MASGVVPAAALRAVFDAPAAMTVGLEEEAMLLDPETLDLAPVASRVLGMAETDGSGASLRLELPASQVEIVTPPAADVSEAIAALAEGRRTLGRAAADAGVRVACVGVHPFAAAEGPLNGGGRYAQLAERYGAVARRQLVGALQVHVCVRGAERVLVVHNALRSFLPDLAALAAHAPFHEGRDTGLASVRPMIATLLPRQGIPPVLASWEAFARGLAWAGDEAAWWWELRPHPRHGTLELRVPDAQGTLADAAAVAAVVHALVAWVAERYDAGEELPVVDTWRIAENRASAYRDGVAGTMLDLETGEPMPTARRLAQLLDDLGPTAERIGCADGLRRARDLVAAGGGATKLRAAAGGDPHAAAAWLADRYLDGMPAAFAGDAGRVSDAS